MATATVLGTEMWLPTSGYTLKVNRSPKFGQLRRHFAPLAAQKDAELLETDIGSAVGGSASRTVKRVTHVEAPGSYPIQGAVETRTLVSRVTVTADETRVLSRIAADSDSRPSTTYQRDLAGNGGGGKLQ